MNTLYNVLYMILYQTSLSRHLPVQPSSSSQDMARPNSRLDLDLYLLGLLESIQGQMFPGNPQ